MKRRLDALVLGALATTALAACTGEMGGASAGASSGGPAVTAGSGSGNGSGNGTGNGATGSGDTTSGAGASGGGSSGPAGSTGAGGAVDVPVAAGEWYEAPNSHMEDVKHNVDGPNMWDVSCVIDCWCGGAYDTKRDRLIVWGGGHGQYSGNELYAFSMKTLSWTRLDDPSNPPGVDVPYAPDGRPTSRHSNSYLQYLPAIDRFCTFGGVGFYIGGQTGTDNVDCFDFDTNQWETSVSTVPAGVTGHTFSAVDHSTGFGYQQGPYSVGKLARYDPASATWTVLDGSNYTGSGYTATAAFDPKRQKMVEIGDGITVWDVDPSSNSVIATNPQTSGDNSIEMGGAVGFDYDPVTETFIAWNGGQTIHSLNVDTMTWTTYAPIGADPGSPSLNHTYGRFRYVPSANLFVVVNASNRNVFVYRHTPDLSAPQWYLDMIAN